MKKGNYKIIEVLWEDATFVSGYYKKENVGEHNLEIMKTAGYLLEEDKKIIKIALTQQDEGKIISDFIVIPKVNILKRRFLR
jgi:hypothetical protein